MYGLRLSYIFRYVLDAGVKRKGRCNKIFKSIGVCSYMSLICRECEDDAEHGAGVIRAELKRGEVKEGPGFIVCFTHAQNIKGKLHKLDELADGPIVVIDERSGYKHAKGTLAWSQPTPRIRILGYMTQKEAKKYLPNTYKYIFEKK